MESFVRKGYQSSQYAPRREAPRRPARTYPVAGARGGEKPRHAADALAPRLARSPPSQHRAAAARLATARPRTEAQGQRP